MVSFEIIKNGLGQLNRGLMNKKYVYTSILAQCVSRKVFGPARSADSDTINTISIPLYIKRYPKFRNPFRGTPCIL